jgi:hypothetical protein
MPQTAARVGLNYTTVAIGGEPAPTTQLITSMISTAFVESVINKILNAGIASLDKTTQNSEMKLAFSLAATEKYIFCGLESVQAMP